MKKSLIALAVMAAAGAASAQSSVTLFGIVDATLAWGKGNGAGSSHRFQLTNSGYNSSRLGFRGTEDLGGGLSASFWLEAGVNNDDGTGSNTNTNNQTTGTSTATAGTQGLTFNRRSTVSLAGNWGEVRLGRDYTPQFWNRTIFDPFGTNGVGTALTQAVGTSLTGQNAVRASNSIGYFLPARLGGFYGQAQYYAGENQSNSGANHRDGTGYAARVGWASGPFNVAGAVSYTRNSVVGGIHQNNIAGQWDFGVAKLMGQYEADSVGATDGRGWLIGGLIPVGPGEIRIAYSSFKVDFNASPAVASPESSKWALGYVHNLSKRTAVYTTYAHQSNKNGSALGLNGALTGVNESASGLDIGIRHSF
ncbi:porin [Ramlibacter sp. G-1-2-2]|uniref:Porin n=1 Tax=Ramlibacter agri TaxID=2728837 RepID=A0A848HG23_9BURK|nr:porin [Ramlibacter agri]NML48389.1 porin [Ramlibacter agri]